MTTSLTPAPRNTTVVFTATVSPVAPATGVPTGTVQFRIDGVNVGGPAAVNANGQAAFATSTIAVGRHTITAVYSGDASFNGSTSGGITQRIN